MPRGPGRRRSERLTEESIKIDARLLRAPQTNQETLGRRIVRHPGKQPAAATIVVADVIHDAGARAVGLRVSSRLDAGKKAHRLKGAYPLRTNCEETDPALLWKRYIQLTKAEAAFRTAKSDLGGDDQKRRRDPAGAARRSAHATAPADRRHPRAGHPPNCSPVSGFACPKGPRIVADAVPKPPLESRNTLRRNNGASN